MFRLRAFGGLLLEQDGAPYLGPATQRRRLALLVVVAASDAGVSRDRLADYLWPDADPARGRHSLDGALSALRRELRNDALFLGVATLRLNPQVLSSDLAEYAAAFDAGDHERCAALYAGPFLDGFYVPGAGEFERWADGERRRRADAHGRLLEGLASAAEGQGDHATAVRWWQARVHLDPVSTPATLRLLEALSASGHPAEALRVARVHEALVRQELDAAPGPRWAAALDGLQSALASPPTSPPAVPSAEVGAGVGAEAAQPSTVSFPLQSPTIGTEAPRDAPVDRPVGSSGRSTGAGPGVRMGWHRRAVPMVAVGVLVIGLLASRAAWRAGTTGQPSAAAMLDPAGSGKNTTAAVRPASVAILPFANTSGDPEDEPFADGLTDELIGALGKVDGIKVTGRTSAFAMKGRPLSVRAVAETLGVTTVLNGSVRRADRRLRVTAELVNASDNRVLWTETYDRGLADVFAVQEEIATAIVDALKPRIGRSPAATRRMRPRDLPTYELYLKGRYFSNRRTPKDLDRAADYFEQAIARDPTYAPAHAGLADTRVLLAIVGGRPPLGELPRAREAAATAIRLDSTLAEAHAAIGNMLEAFEWDWDGAERALAHAAALDPGYATARLYRGIALLHQGRIDRALAELTEARMLDPLSAPAHLQLGRAYVSARRPEEAIRSLRAAIELNPEFGAAHSYLGDAYLQQGNAPEALAAVRRAAALRGARDSAQLVYALAVTGQRREAERVLQELLASSKRRYLSPVQMAMAYTGLGDEDSAFRWLEQGYAERAALMSALKVTPAFDALRADPRWLRLLVRMGLEP